MTFIDINKINRQKLYEIYYKYINNNEIEEGLIKYFEYLENLKDINYQYYKYLMGLLYIDNYSLLIYKSKNQELTEQEQQTIELYNTIEDLDDLLFQIEQDISILYDFSRSSLKLNYFNLKGRIELLNILDDEYVSRFNKFYSIEKENIYGNIDTNDLCNRYKQEMENVNEDNVTYIRNMTIDGIYEIIKSQFQKNIKNYFKILSNMIKTYYIWKFYLKKQYPNILFDEDKIILYLIEVGNNNDIMYNISYNEELLRFLLGEYLHYQVIVSQIDKKEIEDFFNKNNTEQMKIKIKEI